MASNSNTLLEYGPHIYLGHLYGQIDELY